MKILKIIICAEIFFALGHLHAQEITCGSVEDAATKIYRRIKEAVKNGELVLANESRKAFWDVVLVERSCAGLIKLSQEMRISGLSENMAPLSMAEVMGSYQNSLGSSCGSACKFVPIKGPSGSVRGYEIETALPYATQVQQRERFNSEKIRLNPSIAMPAK